MLFPSNTILGVFVISEFCVGVLGNSLLLMLYIFNFWVKARFNRQIDPIFMHLMIVNMLTIIFAMIPYITSSFGVPSFLHDAGCKAFVYIYRVSRAMSISSTSILSTFQAITITPSNSKWAWLKPKLSKWTFCTFLFSWFINMVIYVHLIENVIAKTNYTGVNYGYSHVYCESSPVEYPNPGFFLSVIITRDLVLLVIMIWTSLSMVTLLYRHHKRAQHLRNPRLSSQKSPEHKATHTILLLVNCFVFFYLLNNLITLYDRFYTRGRTGNLGAIITIVASFYPTLCPFLLMNSNKMYFFPSYIQRAIGD
uniref:Vomeronasal type-1 receptor n=1 Tax=Mus musculus musculus TaxID=39442 RepID=F6MD63_MOUSE|nr:vomeronasal type 1 receptor J3 [Mus musculus musculus]AEF00849.1 vomeronasal type 1 receptor J3 [Mus musculus musculus]AEF00850.1 vomeronasal type 1 receptor J3 [Mus musculus musculus]AEF00851.1 vomeronasal type 1 receptor J3 [Mus musculus musculus]AEF00852.1 vomeronasal type 1 receptor J3 [Mus musculus musculus]